ncbi:hypothetical protein Bca4012_017773 [Brassica carinata]
MAASSVFLSDVKAGRCSSSMVETYQKSLAEHQNPDTLNSFILVKRVILTSFCVCSTTGNELLKEQEYHDVVRHHTDAYKEIQKTQPYARPRGMKDPTIQTILTDL